MNHQMYSNYSRLLLREDRLADGYVAFQVAIEGSDNLPVSVSRRDVWLLTGAELYPKELSVAGLKLRYLGEHGDAFIRDSCFYMLINPPNDLRWIWWRARTLLLPRWQWFIQRLVVTFAVWGYANIPFGAIPSWRHITLR